MEIEAIIFDLDGVITDTAEYHFIAWKKLANDLGFDLTPEDNEAIKGLSRVDSLKKILAIGGIKKSEKEIQLLTEQKNNHYKSFLTHITANDLLPGVEEFLKDCKKQNVKIGIGSASKNTPLILQQLQLSNFFDVVIDGSMVSHSKPDPEVFLKGASLMNVNPKNTIVFEDAVAGVQAANKGGFISIGVGNETILSHANYVIPNMKEYNVNKVLNLINRKSNA